MDIRRVTTHENPADIYTKLLPAAILQKHLPQNGLLPLPDGEGEECMYYVKNNGNGNEFQQNTYYNMHKSVKQYKKHNEELQKQVGELRQSVGERDAEVRDLAFNDLLPDQILRAQHALQALQDHLTEKHTRKLLGSEPLQALLGAICQKEQLQQWKKQRRDNHHYIQMIDSMDPIAALQPPEERRRKRRTLQKKQHYKREQQR